MEALRTVEAGLLTGKGFLIGDNMKKDIVIKAHITCPGCGAEHVEVMPDDGYIRFWDVPSARLDGCRRRMIVVCSVVTLMFLVRKIRKG